MADNSLPYLTRPVGDKHFATRDFSEKVFERKSKLSQNPQLKSLQFSELELNQLDLWDRSSFIMSLAVICYAF